MKCRLCGSNNVKFIFEKFSYNNNWNIYKCRKCQTEFIDPEQHGYDLTSIYKNLYDDAEKLESLKDITYACNYWKWQVNIINSLLQNKIKQGKILDIGCNAGHFLYNFNNNFEKYGIELSRVPARFAEQKRIKVFNTRIEDAQFTNNFFDVVTMFAIIEHLIDPLSILKKINRVLKEGGIMVIMTGDTSSLKAKILGAKWQMYCPPEHQFFYSARSLSWATKKCGFKKVKTIYTDGGMTKLNNRYVNFAVRKILNLVEKTPIINSLPIFDHNYGYYRKINEFTF